MCYLVVERYSVCGCLYYKHSIDMCAAYGTQGHPVQERTVLVGYACEEHSAANPVSFSNRMIMASKRYSFVGELVSNFARFNLIWFSLPYAISGDVQH
jgi:hypothetical protein